MKTLRFLAHKKILAARLAITLSFSLLGVSSVLAETGVPSITPEQSKAFQQGWTAMKNNQLDKAFRIWDELSHNPNNSPQLKRALANNIAVILMRQKKFQEAQRRLDASLQEDQQIARTLDNLNQIYAYQAQKAYNRVFEKSKLKAPKGELLFVEASEFTPVEKTPEPIQIAEAPKQEPKETSKKVVPQPKVVKTEPAPVLNENLINVAGLIESWRQAWAGQDVDRYLSFYDEKDFQPRNGMSYETWEKSRHRSLTNPKYINLYLDDIQVKQQEPNIIRVEFNQRYRSDRFRDTIHKVLIWKKDHSDWKIIREEVVYAKKK